jgi:PAS domain S-box-containing protein
MGGWIVGACLLSCLALTVMLVSGRRRLAASREAFNLLSRHAPVGILQADAAGMCVYANGGWCELSGLSLEETLGQSWSRSVHPDDLPDVMEKWQHSIAARQPYVNEVRLLRPDGTIRTVLATAQPIHDDRGHITGFIGTVLDVTSRRSAERDLGRRERLLRSLIDVQENEKQLLCHEFHDGLIQYAVGSKMLLEGLRESELGEPGRGVVDAVIECLAKGIEDGRRVIRGIRPAALDDLGLRAALDDLADELRASGIRVDAALDPAIDLVPPPLQTTLYRVAQESFNNVRKHSGSDSVRLTVARVDGHVELTTADSGRGFDQSATTAEGFGLLGVRERVRLLGGECDVDSAPGRGTRLRVTLPIQADDVAVALGAQG